eukprot:scpid54983/ scgid5703/ 
MANRCGGALFSIRLFAVSSGHASRCLPSSLTLLLLMMLSTTTTTLVSAKSIQPSGHRGAQQMVVPVSDADAQETTPDLATMSMAYDDTTNRKARSDEDHADSHGCAWAAFVEVDRGVVLTSVCETQNMTYERIVLKTPSIHQIASHHSRQHFAGEVLVGSRNSRLYDLENTHLPSWPCKDLSDTENFYQTGKYLTAVRDSLLDLCNGTHSMLMEAQERQKCLDNDPSSTQSTTSTQRQVTRRAIIRIRRSLCVKLLPGLEKKVEEYKYRNWHTCARLIEQPSTHNEVDDSSADHDPLSNFLSNESDVATISPPLTWDELSKDYPDFSCTHSRSAHQDMAAFVQYVLRRVENIYTIVNEAQSKIKVRQYLCGWRSVKNQLTAA